MTTLKVFISYAHSDRAWAQKFAKTLMEFGLDASLDQLDTLSEQDWVEGLEKTLRESDIVVVLIPPDDIGHPYVLAELGAALALGKSVIPIIPREIEASKLPFPLRRQQRLVRTSPEETAQELTRTIEALKEAA